MAPHPGAILQQVPQDDEPANFDFAGSSLVVEATSREEIVELLRRDVYAEKVWDLDKVSPGPHAWTVDGFRHHEQPCGCYPWVLIPGSTGTSVALQVRVQKGKVEKMLG